MKFPGYLLYAFATVFPATGEEEAVDGLPFSYAYCGDAVRSPPSRARLAVLFDVRI